MQAINKFFGVDAHSPLVRDLNMMKTHFQQGNYCRSLGFALKIELVSIIGLIAIPILWCYNFVRGLGQSELIDKVAVKDFFYFIGYAITTAVAFPILLGLSLCIKKAL